MGVTMTGMRKQMTTATLRIICKNAQRLGFSNGPNGRFWRHVDAKGIHVCCESYFHTPNLAMWRNVDHPFNFAHNDGVNIRAVVMCKMKGRQDPVYLLCDFDEADFRKLDDIPAKMLRRRGM